MNMARRSLSSKFWKIKDDPNFNLNDELTLLEQIWLEKLRPFGELGYNTDTNIRQS
jgi:hypothetical protein